MPCTTHTLICRYISSLKPRLCIPKKANDTPQLITISGYPCSGKSHRATQLQKAFESRISSSTDPSHAKLKVHIINDQNLGLKTDVYHSARPEKDARAAELSAIKRLLGKDDIIIADGLNYIKGFRYQLYCEAKALGTPSCVVRSALL